jgi:phospholipid/cholesterol/gamma-HCH transport system substrate-binding protein
MVRSVLAALEGEVSAVSRSLSRWQAILLGLVVLLALGLAGVGLFLVGSRTWFAGDSFHVRSGFKAVQGVEPGTRVRVQGIDAGEVVAIEPPATPGSDVVLRMRIDGKMRALVRTDATVRIVSEGLIGGKVVEVSPGSDTSEPVKDNALLASRPTTELADVLDEVKTTLQNVRDGEGTVGKELVGTLQQTRATMESFEKTGNAVRKLPIVRGYDRDAQALLVRPGAERVRSVFAESDLFEPGRSTLTASGRQHLDALAERIKGSLKHDGADLVVVATADPKTSASPSLARSLTESQSTTVVNYLKDHHSIQKAGWMSWRDITALGLGTDPYPGEDKDAKLPPARVEVLVFVPQK